MIERLWCLPAMFAESNEIETAGEWIIDFHKLLGTVVEKPLPYGPYHLFCFGLIIFLTVLLSYLMRNAGPGAMKAMLVGFWLLMVSTEFVSQFWSSAHLIEGELVWYNRWTSFPFQVCATGMWILPIIFASREGKFKDALMMYMGLYSLFGGVLVVCVPTTVFSIYAVKNVHTMIQHGSQIIVGIMILVNYRKKLNFRLFLSAIPVFLVCAGIAVGLNELLYHLGMAFGDQHYTANMFYFSHRFNSNMPVVGPIYEALPWGMFFALYIICFILITFIIYFIAILSIHIAETIRERRRAASDADSAAKSEERLVE